jgi:hypothetical protein
MIFCMFKERLTSRGVLRFAVWTAGILASLAVITTAAPLAGCTATRVETPMVIPVNYYACLEVYPDDLLKTYFHPALGGAAQADLSFKDIPVLFRNILIDERMLTDRERDIFYISSVHCTPLSQGAVAELRAGDVIDIVGINRGAWTEATGWLSFTDCLFLPAGAVALPAPGGPSFNPGY